MKVSLLPTTPHCRFDSLEPGDVFKIELRDDSQTYMRIDDINLDSLSEGARGRGVNLKTGTVLVDTTDCLQVYSFPASMVYLNEEER